MKIVGKKLSREEFSEYLKNKNLGKLPPNKLVIHHTFRPTVESWNGDITIQAMKKFYERKGWNAGPHIFCAPDGIWLFTDMYEVGIHAGIGNATYEKDGKEIKGYKKPAGYKLKEYSIGIEAVGFYDSKVWEGEVKENMLHVIKELQKKIKVGNEAVFFHRDFTNSKSCPGWAITKEWLFNELKEKPEVKIPEGHTPSPWAKEDWDWATSHQYFNGKNPQGMFTREQAAIVIRRLEKKIFAAISNRSRR